MKKLFPNNNGKLVSIPVVTERCEKNCCSITMIPLRVCQSITIHKSQGMTIKENKIFTKLVLYLTDSESGGRRTPGSELVGMSRANDLSCLAIGNESKNLSIQDIQKIGNTKAYYLRREFERDLKKKAADTQAKVIKAIKRLDTSKKRTYEGGCEFLLNWYKEEIQTNFVERLKQLELEAKAKPPPEPCLDIEIEAVKV